MFPGAGELKEEGKTEREEWGQEWIDEQMDREGT